jgi:Protein of unknown function (DUF4232)
MTHMRRFAGAVLLGSMALLLAACGSSASTAGAASSHSVGSPPTSSAAASSPAPSPDVSSSAASAHAAGVPACATSDLSVTLGGSQGTAGSIYQTIDFTNTSSTTCNLYGYPGVSLTAGNPPTQVGQAAAHSTTYPATFVTLAPGAVANAAVQVTEAGNYSSDDCDPTAATALLIYPPNQTASVSLPYTTTGCASQQITILHVSVVQAGATSGG